MFRIVIARVIARSNPATSPPTPLQKRGEFPCRKDAMRCVSTFRGIIALFRPFVHPPAPFKGG
jgi:hypothetical protein